MALVLLLLVGLTIILTSVNTGPQDVKGISEESSKNSSDNSQNSDDDLISGEMPASRNDDSLPKTSDSDTDLADTLGIDPTVWNLKLVNSENVLMEDVDIELAAISGDLQVDARISDALNAFLSAGNAEGLSVYVCSAYRTIDYQTGLFERRINRWVDSGLGYDDAAEAAATSVAEPGTSEHHLGLAVDIICNEYTSLTSGFGETAAGIWLKKHCAEYGFILRYPEDKTDITGYVYEPWHFRYVGVEAATYIMDNAICFEEFWDLLK
jgi:D-alanyl-D-alanine carboxypeptidase